MTEKIPDGQAQDLFLDGLIDAPIKAEQAGLEHPFFALEKQPRMTPIIYEHGDVKIEVTAGPKGIATIYDKDILMYVSSVVNDRLERGLTVSPKIRFAAHDFLTATQRGKGGKAYGLFLDALDRLQTTGIKTTIESGAERQRRTFTWIASSQIIEDKRADGTRRMRAVEIELCDWMYKAVVQDRRVLTIHPAYFRLTGGVERRLYEIARKHCGRQEEWSIMLPRLAQKVGTTRELKKFRADLVAIAKADQLPEYRYQVVYAPQGSLIEYDLVSGEAPARMKLERVKVIVQPKRKAVDN